MENKEAETEETQDSSNVEEREVNKSRNRLYKTGFNTVAFYPSMKWIPGTYKKERKKERRKRLGMPLHNEGVKTLVSRAWKKLLENVVQKRKIMEHGRDGREEKYQ